MSSTALIIPARMGSTRLPRKALADIDGKPMVVRVAERAAQVRGISEILVATDHAEIVRAVEAAGFRAVMTPESLKSGTDRVAYVAKGLKHEFIVNLQGDEPVVPPEAVEAAMEPVLGGRTKMGSVCTVLRSREDFLSPSVVKVITDCDGNAVTFSRLPIPYRKPEFDDDRVFQEPHLGKHLGIYVYRRDFLLEFAGWEPVFWEQWESLEQLRALHHGVKIGMGRIERDSQSVDTEEDLQKARKAFLEENR